MLREMTVTEIAKGSGNVYADIGTADADEMRVKAQLAGKMGEIIKARRWTQQRAAEVPSISQPKLSQLLREPFRGIGEAKMLQLPARLGRNAQIVAGPPKRVRRKRDARKSCSQRDTLCRKFRESSGRRMVILKCSNLSAAAA